ATVAPKLAPRSSRSTGTLVAKNLLPARTNANKEEEQFYSPYAWCLNPALSVRDLLLRLQEEIERYSSLAGWQREESKVNLYLFTCAVACTVDDYLALQPLIFSALTKRFSESHALTGAVRIIARGIEFLLRL